MKMTVTMALDGTKGADRFAYTLLEQAFRLRGGAMGQQGQKLSKDDRRKDAKILHALNAISVPRTKDDNGGDLKAPPEGTPDGRPRELLHSQETLTLDVPEFERLQKFFDSEDMQWSVHVTEAVEDLSQRLTSALAAAQKKD